MQPNELHPGPLKCFYHLFNLVKKNKIKKKKKILRVVWPRGKYTVDMQLHYKYVSTVSD